MGMIHPLRTRYIQVAADFSCQNVVHFCVPGDRCTLVVFGVSPPRMSASFSNWSAPMSRKVRKQVSPSHTSILTSSYEPAVAAAVTASA